MTTLKLKIKKLYSFLTSKGLKTGLYYLRTRPAADPIKFTVDKTKLKSTKDFKLAETVAHEENGTRHVNGKQDNHTNGTKETNGVEKDLTSNDDLIEQLKLACSLQNKDACMMCSS